MNKEQEWKALIEVRKWKKEVAKEASKLRGQARLNFYNQSNKTWKAKKAA